MGLSDRLENWPPYRWLYRHRDGTGRPWTQESRQWLLERRYRVALLLLMAHGSGLIVGDALSLPLTMDLYLWAFWVLITVYVGHHWL
jgi:hypothetical protein